MTRQASAIVRRGTQPTSLREAMQDLMSVQNQRASSRRLVRKLMSFSSGDVDLLEKNPITPATARRNAPSVQGSSARHGARSSDRSPLHQSRGNNRGARGATASTRQRKGPLLEIIDVGSWRIKTSLRI
jgi:hypothetical protein